MKKLGKIYLGFWLIILYLPFLLVVLFSFNSSKYLTVWKGFTADWYFKLFQSSNELTFVNNSLKLTLTVMLIAVPIGILSGIFLAKQKRLLKRYLETLTFIQVIIPEIVMGISLAIFFSLFNITLSFYTILIAHITFCIGFFILSFIAQLDIRFWDFAKVAKDLGANFRTTISKIFLPLLIRPVVASTFLIAAISLDNYIISLFTAGASSTTFPIYIFSSVRQGISPIANAGAVFMMMVVFTMSIFAFRLILLNQRKTSNNEA